jgi:hypothetical protein
VARFTGGAAFEIGANSSSGVIAMPGGQPSITQPMAGPWLSPKVVTRSRRPKLLSLIRRGRSSASALIRAWCCHQIGALHREDAHLSDLELDPAERQFRQQFDQGALGLAHFADQQPVFGQVLRRVAQDAQGEIQAIVSGTQAQLGFVCVLLAMRRFRRW